MILWATIGLLLQVLGWAWDTWQFWAMLGTYWAVSEVSRTKGHLEGIMGFLSLSAEEQQRLRRALTEAKEDQT